MLWPALACWRDPGFSYAWCCASEFGPGGNPGCWEDGRTYEACCSCGGSPLERHFLAPLGCGAVRQTREDAALQAGLRVYPLQGGAALAFRASRVAGPPRRAERVSKRERKPVISPLDGYPSALDATGFPTKNGDPVCAYIILICTNRVTT